MKKLLCFALFAIALLAFWPVQADTLTLTLVGQGGVSSNVTPKGYPKEEKATAVEAANKANPVAAASAQARFDSLQAAANQGDTDVPVSDAAPQVSLLGAFWDALKLAVAEHWGKVLAFLLSVVSVYVLATPNTRDDVVFGWIRRLFESVIPGLKGKK